MLSSVIASLALGACSAPEFGEPQPASWHLTEEPHGSALHIGVVIGACARPNGTDVVESDDTVTIDSTSRHLRSTPRGVSHCRQLSPGDR
jgi:hypothetical protein